LDTLNPATAGEARRSAIMARKNYTEEFRRQAVDLYRSTPGATLRGIAADSGISRHTLQVWVHALDPDPSSPSSDAPAT
jgi:transposase